MADREKVIKGLNSCSGSDPCVNSCPYYDGCGNNYSCTGKLAKDALSLLKEQQQQIWDLQDQVEYLTDKQKKKFLVYSDGKITPLPDIVRCKDCVYRGNEKRCIIAFIADKQDFPFFFYDNHGEWFCADGSRKDGEANEHGRGKADEH